MGTSETATRRLGLALYRLLFVALCAALTLHVFWVFIRDPGINTYHRAMFGDVVEGRAHKPYVTRWLVPLTTRAVHAALPPQTRVALGEGMAGNVLVQGFLRRGQWERELLPQYAIALVLMFAALVGLVFAFRWLHDGVFPPNRWRKDAATVLLLVGLPPCFYYASYLSDFPGLFLWTLGLGLLVRERWGAYLAVFLIGCLNKETFILMWGVFALRYLWSRKMARRTFWSLAAAQLGMFVAVKLALGWVYRDNPGVSFELHWEDHTLALGEHLSRRNELWAMSLWLAGAALAFLRWRTQPRFLKQSVAVLPVLIALTAVFGFLDELRDYYEAYPTLVLMLVHTLSWRPRSRVSRAGAYTLRPAA
ncbi:MAG: hypothetical protein M3Y59_13015 [Myxococcota bacterium]|nr:hypothetical protein [Myxococcota bacterium]